MSSSFLEYWEQVKFRLESEFRQWVPELFRDLPQSQVDAILRSLKAGKRIRGCLVCLVCEALDGDIDAAVSKAVGIECIQAASLIHDDYVDGDKIRRNRPAEWTLQGSRQAVLLGDVIFASVIGKMVEEGIEEGSLISKAIAAMAMGAYQEHLDRVNFERLAREGNYRPETYERVIHLKTGVLFAAAAQLGAIAAKASAPERRRAFNFGARLGEAYQIADDLVEVLKLEHLPRLRLTNLSATGPILLRFSKMIPADLDEFSRNTSKLALREFSLIKNRMREEISARFESANSEISDFPRNPYTHLLHEMPTEIIRSMELASGIARLSLYGRTVTSAR